MPLKAGEDEDYLLALKQEIRGRMKSLPFNIKPCSDRSGELCSCTLNHCTVTQCAVAFISRILKLLTDSHMEHIKCFWIGVHTPSDICFHFHHGLK